MFLSGLPVSSTFTYQETLVFFQWLNIEYKIPGLLFYETKLPDDLPNSYDSRPWIYDFAIVVVDINRSLRQRTVESIRILERKETPFIVVLNKLDTLNRWRTTTDKDVQDALENQTEATRIEFHELVASFISSFRTVNRETNLYYNVSPSSACVSLVPTAESGEGIGNLLHLIVKSCQTSSITQRLRNRDALLTNVYRKEFVDDVGSSKHCVRYNPQVQKVKGVHSVKIQNIESDNGIEIEEVKGVHSVKVQSRKGENAIEIEEVKGIRSVKIQARENASAESNVSIAWGTAFYRRLFRINLNFPLFKRNAEIKVRDLLEKRSIS